MDYNYIISKEYGDDFEYNPAFVNFTESEAKEKGFWPKRRTMPTKAEMQTLWDTKYKAEIDGIELKETALELKRKEAPGKIKDILKNGEPKNTKELYDLVLLLADHVGLDLT